MSTGAIRSVILRYREALGDDILPGQAEAIRGATEEVEAIEKAASTIMSVGPDLGEKLNAYKTLKSVWQSVPYVIDPTETP